MLLFLKLYQLSWYCVSIITVYVESFNFRQTLSDVTANVCRKVMVNCVPEVFSKCVRARSVQQVCDVPEVYSKCVSQSYDKLCAGNVQQVCVINLRYTVCQKYVPQSCGKLVQQLACQRKQNFTCEKYTSGTCSVSSSSKLAADML